MGRRVWVPTVAAPLKFNVELTVTITLNVMVNSRERLAGREANVLAGIVIYIKTFTFASFSFLTSAERVGTSIAHITTRVISNVNFLNTNIVVDSNAGVGNMGATTSV